MKHFVTVLSAIAFAVAALAQTPEEIVSRMEAEMDKHENDGIIMTVDVKIPILGTMTTKTYALGDKLRVEGKMMGVDIVTWSDGVTEWSYNSKTNTIEITQEKTKESSDGDAEMFQGLTDGYDVSISKETAEAWHILCKKSKANTDKDAPKTVNLVVAKSNYYPLSLSAKVSGVTMTMRDIAFGVTEKQVTFDPKDYPNAKIVDKR
ncbi:MAG: hypothetical protein IKX53_05730 [Bacteroidales bacterium]|nr:hypothetical protein [Bacteroidales bacterium]